MKAALLVIGDEILSGETKDTNSGFSAEILTQNTLDVVNILTVNDKPQNIKEGLDFLLCKADLIITTGGLGPTRDDLTAKTLCDYFGGEMIFNEEVFIDLKERYQKLSKSLNKLNKSQAMVPNKAKVFKNPVGTAPCLWFDYQGKVIISLPGVPYEMRFLLENIFLPEIKKHFLKGHIIHKTIHLVGIPESDLAEKISNVDDEIENENSETDYYKLAYLPALGQIKLRLIAAGPDEKSLKIKLQHFQKMIETLVPQHIFGYDKDEFSANIGKILKSAKATLSTAESCTGGYLAHLITSVNGSSDYYQGSVISYANEVKMNDLRVKKSTLEKFGAVSEETAREMLNGCLEKFGTTYAIVTTGIAGPGGGSEEKPAGTIWIGAGSKENQIIRKFRFNRNRTENIHLFSITALDLLRRLVLKHKV